MGTKKTSKPKKAVKPAKSIKPDKKKAVAKKAVSKPAAPKKKPLPARKAAVKDARKAPKKAARPAAKPAARPATRPVAKKAAKPVVKAAPKVGVKAGHKAAKATKAVAHVKEVKKEVKAVKKIAAPEVKPAVAKPVAAKPVATKPVAAKPAAAKPVIAPPVVEVRPKPTGKLLPRAFMVELAEAIKAAILPCVREARGREVVGSATTGDATFEVDRIAEKALLTFLKNARMPVAYYSEDSGYTTFTNTQPQNLLIIDPIDGTRAAKSGFEGCVIAIASTRIIERPCMADVDNACVMEIVGDRVFYAERGTGVRITQGGHQKRQKLSKNDDLETLVWSMTVPARPAEIIFPVAARLIDLSSLKGGFFACNSTSFSLTRLVTNQLDACVDIANRFIRDIPGLVKDQFINSGRGTVIGIAPYDMVAALLIAEEAGCVVTDAYGKKFDDVLLLDTAEENHRSMIAAANHALHAKLVQYFDMRIKQWEHLLRVRAERAAARAEAH